MAISQKDQLALHEFSQRYRAAYAAKNPLADLHLETVYDALRIAWERDSLFRESSGLQGPQIQSPEISGPEIKGPEIGPSDAGKEPEPEEPEP